MRRKLIGFAIVVLAASLIGRGLLGQEIAHNHGLPAALTYEQKNANLTMYVVNGIDLKTTGATTIATTDSGGDRFHPLFTLVEVTAQSGLAVGATFSVGTNASTYNDITAASTTGITANKALSTPVTALTDSVAPGTAIKVNISVAATGTSGTCSASVIGYYK